MLLLVDKIVLYVQLQNPQCRLHWSGKMKTCGLRELGRSDQHSVVFWQPSVCIKLGCQCLATKEIRRARSITVDPDNRVEIEFRRFRVFECI